MFSDSPVDRDITLYSSFPVVLPDLPCIIDCICGDELGTNLHLGDLKCFEGWLAEPRIIDICGCNRIGKGKTVPIDQNTQLIPFTFL